MASKKSKEGVSPEDQELVDLEKDIEAENKGSEGAGEPGEGSQPESPTGKEKAPEKVKSPEGEPKAPSTGEEEPEEDLAPEEVSQLSPRAQKRYRKLVADNREWRRKAEGKAPSEGEEEPAEEEETEEKREWTPQEEIRQHEEQEGQPGKLPWQGKPGEGEEDQEGEEGEVVLTKDQLQQMIHDEAGKIYQKERQIERDQEQLTNDVTEVEKAYPELNPDGKNDKYDQGLVDFIQNQYLALKRTYPRLRLKTFTDKLMGLRQKAVENDQQEVNGEIAQQAAEQAVGPSATKPTTRGLQPTLDEAQGMEVEELEKTLPHAAER